MEKVNKNITNNIIENRTNRVIADAVHTTKAFINLGEIDKAKDFIQKAIENWESNKNTNAVIQFKEMLEEERKNLEDKNIKLF